MNIITGNLIVSVLASLLAITPHQLTTQTNTQPQRSESTQVAKAKRGAKGAEDNVRLVRMLYVGREGSHVVRYGDLNGDGNADSLFVQSRGRRISAMTAMTLNGDILWRTGKPSPRAFRLSADLPVQLVDWDDDGITDVISVESALLRVRRGYDGAIIHQTPVPRKARDSVFLFSEERQDAPDRVLIKDRYNSVWVYDRNLNLKWSTSLKTGHFPAQYDVFKTGHEPIAIGFALFNPNGQLLWKRDDLGRSSFAHADSHDFGDIDGDGTIELAIAPSGPAVILDAASGRTRLNLRSGDTQHVALGRFAWQIPTDVIMTASRGPDTKDWAKVSCFNLDGDLIGSKRFNNREIIVSGVDGWTGDPNQSVLAVYRTRNGPPELIDCQGKLLHRFKLPKRGQRIFNSSRNRSTFVQHFNVSGDSREEILINSERALWIYENTAPLPAAARAVNTSLPNRRIFNATFYVGMQ